jgi:16S rRNA (guanine527-N7)-methyltransferase
MGLKVPSPFTGEGLPLWESIMQLLSEFAAKKFNIQLTDAHLSAFKVYARELADWNERMNLTAITSPDAVQIRHFLDSLSITQAVPMTDTLRLVDVGTGAGFPGLPLAIVYPNIKVTLLEATGKKVNFLDHICDMLDLSNVTTLRARAEEAGHDNLHRAQYDLAVARSVARLPALLEYLLPLVKTGGHAIAMKGSTAQEEADDCKHALKILGGKLDRIDTIQLPAMDYPHHLVVVEKVHRTPKTYPRNPGTPTREPL